MKKTSSLVMISLIVVSTFSILSLGVNTEEELVSWTGLDDPMGVAIGDYDNDGSNDLAFIESGAAQRLTVYKNDGTTVIEQFFLDDPHYVAIGDYDNDGSNDLAFTERIPGNVTVLKSDGTVIKQWTGRDSPHGVAIGDYDNDGLNDLAFTDTGTTDTVTVYNSTGAEIEKWTGLDDPQCIAIGDYDNDGLNDLAFSEAGDVRPDRVTVYKSDGTTVIRQWIGLDLPIGVAIGDYDNDGLNDLVFTQAGSTDNVTVYDSNGMVIKQWAVVDNPYGVAIGDYNNNGLNNLAVAEPGVSDRVTVYLAHPPPPVNAIVDIDPSTLNLKSNGQWVTAYIEVPESHHVEDIDISTVMLNNTIPGDLDAPTQVGDYDLDGLPDLMVKFDRAFIIEWLGEIDHSEDTGKSCFVTLAITGKISDTAFEGSDTIKVLRR